jgi:hypothetical protein
MQNSKVQEVSDDARRSASICCNACEHQTSSLTSTIPPLVAGLLPIPASTDLPVPCDPHMLVITAVYVSPAATDTTVAVPIPPNPLVNCSSMADGPADVQLGKPKTLDSTI